MNKYKMISITSFAIACVLVMSLLLPYKTIANDKESLEIYMNYQDSKVTVDITVNSDVYTGVVCKYLMVDNALIEQDLVNKTKNNGTTINIDKSESDKYTAVIDNVTKRYVVVYVSIGNCTLCDYIDCMPNQKEETDIKQDDKTENDNKEHEMSVEGEGVNGEKVESTTNNVDEDKTEKPAEDKTEKPAEDKTEKPAEDKTEKPAEDKTEKPAEDKTEKPAEDKTEKPAEDKTEKPAEDKTEKPAEDKTEKPAEDKTEKPAEDKTEKPAEDKTEKPAEDKTEKPAEDKTEKPAEDKTEKPAEDKTEKPAQNKTEQVSNSGNSQTTNNSNKGSAVVDKDSIDVSAMLGEDINGINLDDFEEIEKLITSQMAEEQMPKTGEDDYIKIFGVVLFSTISAFSFYMYKKTK